MDAQKIKNRFDQLVEKPEGYPPSDKAKGVYVGKLTKACGNDADRKLVLKYLTGKTSSKEMTANEWAALRQMVDNLPAQDLEFYCKLVLGAVVKQEGQTEMELI